MPLYEYRCSDCGHSFEKMVRFSDAPQLPECPHCHSPQTEKKLSTIAASFSSVGGSSSSGGSSCGGGGRFT